MDEAKADRSLLADRDEQGKEQPRAFGRMRGKIRIAEDFDAPLPDDVAGSVRDRSRLAEAMRPPRAIRGSLGRLDGPIRRVG